MKKRRQFKAILSLGVSFCLILIPVHLSLGISSEVDLHACQIHIEKRAQEVSPVGLEEKFSILYPDFLSGLVHWDISASLQRISFPFHPPSPNEKISRILRR
jgi:hypothetical protein